MPRLHPSDMCQNFSELHRWYCSLERGHFGDHVGYADHNPLNSNFRTWENLTHPPVNGNRPKKSFKLD